MTDCECSGPGYCNRYHKEITPHNWHLCQTREDYRKKWEDNVKHFKCEHFGAYTNKLEICPSCRGKVKVKIFDCTIHGECTFTKHIPNIACCKSCKEFQCVECKFDKTGKCIKCGYVLETKPHIPEADTIVRECKEPKDEMTLVYTSDGNPAFIRDQYSSPMGSSIFFIGCGPSLLQQNLELLRQPHIQTFAVNNVAAKTFKRPTFWCCVDEPKSFHEIIWSDPSIIKFLPMNKSGKHFYKVKNGKNFINSGYAAHKNPNVFLFNLNAEFNHNTFLTENSVNWGCNRGIGDSLGIKSGRSVLLCAFKLMYYLGFKRIYLLGCDFNMQHDDKGNGRGLTYAFSQYKWKGGCKTNNDCYSIIDKRLTALRPLLEEKGVTVKNCTPNSKLTAFDYMDYEEAVKEEAYKEKVYTNDMYG